ncbi:MAG: YqiA/YcfP family alpha/beta fold hydrolase [Desulfobacteraceae bacterium]|jgi:pimeloyl-ACP methyl ester carboxylesterase
MAVRIFLHGLESSNQGTKAVFFRERHPDMILPNFTGPLEERMEKLNGILSEKTGIILVGSSFGGLMASIFAMENEPRVDRLVLLAPAINLMDSTEYSEQRISVPVWIYHGKEDEVIPLKDVEKVANKVFSNLSFEVVDDDHFLHKTFKNLDWDSLLA